MKLLREIYVKSVQKIGMFAWAVSQKMGQHLIHVQTPAPVSTTSPMLPEEPVPVVAPDPLAALHGAATGLKDLLNEIEGEEGIKDIKYNVDGKFFWRPEFGAGTGKTKETVQTHQIPRKGKVVKQVSAPKCKPIDISIDDENDKLPFDGQDYIGNKKIWSISDIKQLAKEMQTSENGEPIKTTVDDIIPEEDEMIDSIKRTYEQSLLMTKPDLPTKSVKYRDSKKGWL